MLCPSLCLDASGRLLRVSLPHTLVPPSMFDLYYLFMIRSGLRRRLEPHYSTILPLLDYSLFSRDNSGGNAGNSDTCSGNGSSSSSTDKSESSSSNAISGGSSSNTNSNTSSRVTDLDKYWDQRYRLFSKYDHGVKLDDESWYSVTPEIIAQHIANRCYLALSRWQREDNRTLGSSRRVDIEGQGTNGLDTEGVNKVVGKVDVGLKTGQHTINDELVVWDLFSGCGGNAIPLALTFPRVVAVDIDEGKIPHLLHNATIYGNSRTPSHSHALLHIFSHSFLNSTHSSPPFSPNFRAHSLTHRPSLNAPAF